MDERYERTITCGVNVLMLHSSSRKLVLFVKGELKKFQNFPNFSLSAVGLILKKRLKPNTQSILIPHFSAFFLVIVEYE